MQFFNRIFKHTDVLVGIGLLVVVSMLILPLPSWALDIGLVLALSSSVLILLNSVNVKDPLEFSVFPSLLVVTTLFRLSISIAATKAILGTGQAGHVIETFGQFVMGGDFVVGFVVFIILVIVQFLVITNGAGRVSEVVARFTLDAMPGKQMAIDADLGAGLIDEDTARQRRKTIKQEADFYGAMDGASKFVKGDAIAAILMIVINIIGGFAVGMLKGQSDPLTILKTYSLLSVGEGITSQLPALLISSASGLLVTRAGQERTMGGQVFSQFFAQPKAIGVTGVAIAAFALVPGFPALIFLAAGGGMIALSRFLSANAGAARMFDVKPEEPKKTAQAPVPTGPESVLPLIAVEPIEIEVGYGLARLAEAKAGGDLPDRVSATRRQIALELGFVIPSVRIRDSIDLDTNEYIVKIRGEEVARASILPTHLLAVNGGSAIESIPGIPGKDPVFNLEALWIEPAHHENAERVGYTVIEPSAVISTHLSEIVKVYAPELISRQDVQQLVDEAKKHNEAVVTELVPAVLGLAEIQKVLQHLLRERVPIRDMVTILETMADYGARTKDPEQLGELVRSAIARTITRQYVDPENKLFCITLDPSLERQMIDKINVNSLGSVLAMEPDLQANVVSSLKTQFDEAANRGLTPVLLCGTQIRLPMRRLLDRFLPTLAVIAYNEVSSKADVEFVGQVRVA